MKYLPRRPREGGRRVPALWRREPQQKEEIDEKTKFAHSLMAVVLGSVLVSGSALAEDSLLNKASNAADSAGAKIDSSMKKVDGYMDDSAITAKVKSALVEDKTIKSSDISVKTEKAP